MSKLISKLASTSEKSKFLYFYGENCLSLFTENSVVSVLVCYKRNGLLIDC